MFKFNVMINLLQLRELRRGGCKFTWTNKRVNPTMEVLDRILVSNSWEALHPKTLVSSTTRSRFDHCPIFVDLGNSGPVKPSMFRLETSWFVRPDFEDLVLAKWPCRTQRKILDYWKHQQNELRRFFEGLVKK